ncbi:nucleotidyltransferase family protein [Magnetospirillum moscoviense]|uniref:Nucleotidyltransferase n=1 Tax=Magnetospirillum moscoviense TaxID=1437059 RepID=A0A178MQX5_9PROT|nr:nucleotidyltransferase domain-containing protein [Magnetospirillum moscoviense]OAN50475.1 nucleotidyltransferase [Magnetospirillum moscoviense]
MPGIPSLDDIVRVLKDHETDFRACGVTRLTVFGSVARGDATEDSDIDLVIDYDSDSRFSLLTLADVQMNATSWLGRKVDVVSRRALKSRFAAFVERDGVDVFPA